MNFQSPYLRRFLPCRFQRTSKRCGISLVETLVTLTCISILLGLLSTAIGQARAAARRVSCENNLRQLGIANSSYVERERKFAPLRGKNALSFISPIVHLLADLGEPVLHNVLSVSEVIHDTSVTSRYDSIPRVLICPSGAGVVGSNYRANVGSTWEAAFSEGGGGNGAFCRSRDVRPGDFSDGLSNTLLFAERSRGKGFLSKDSIRYLDIYLTSDETLRMTPSDIVELIRSNPATSGSCDTAGGQWTAGSYLNSWYTHIDKPNSRFDASLGVSVPQFGVTNASVSASSEHGAMVNGVLADGSVRSFGSNIDYEVWRALGTRAGGEIVELAE